MTLREALGGDVGRIHELVDRLLDQEDALLVLFDGERSVSYVEGLGLSPCQSELLAVQIERVVRAAGAARNPKRRTEALPTLE